MQSSNNEADNNQVMTLSEIANYLKVSEKTILRMAQGGDIPGAKISNQWRFMKAIIDDWFTMKMQSATKKDLAEVINTAEKIIPLSRLITEDRILLEIPGNASKNQILEMLAEPLIQSGVVDNGKIYASRLAEREEMISTAIGHGVAVPHARETEGCRINESALVLGICSEGTDFNALDGNPTHLFFLVCATSDVIHLRLMAKISMLMKKPAIAEAFCACKDPQEVVALLRETDMEIVMHH